MSFEAGKPGDTYTYELWQTVCCRYFITGQHAAGKRVLEVGCGTGRGLGYLAARASEVIGGDISEENLNHAKAHYGDRVKLVVLDASRLPFPNGSFDVVAALEVLQYLPQPEQFLDECRRVLRPGGNLIVCVPNREVRGFRASPESINRYSAPELYSLLSWHNFNAEISGAFPITGHPFWHAVRAVTIFYAGSCLEKLPGGKKIKQRASRVFLKRNIDYKAEIEESDIDVKACTLTPIAGGASDFRHRIIYGFGNIQ